MSSISTSKAIYKQLFRLISELGEHRLLAALNEIDVEYYKNHYEDFNQIVKKSYEIFNTNKDKFFNPHVYDNNTVFARYSVCEILINTLKLSHKTTSKVMKVSDKQTYRLIRNSEINKREFRKRHETLMQFTENLIKNKYINE